MAKQFRATLVAFVVLAALTGLLYPVVMTAIAQTVFPAQANGSLIVQNGTVIGSQLIGQPFSDPRYFWGRPSATGPVPYTAYNADKGTGSTGSNLGPLNPALVGDGSNNTPEGTVRSAIDALKAADPDNTAAIPVDLVTASASGLDPDISPAGAAYQVHRVAKARGLDPATIQDLVDKYTTGRSLSILGEPHVNVLMLNLALDALPGQNPPPEATAAATAAATAGK
ncbi:MAG TPA: potassium-transporting ATPase subunit KdpC [Aggregatilineales bacterium]|nr:potassium-transporting ATPase subunit KdpC [Aggregatilineales bacterium]